MVLTDKWIEVTPTRKTLLLYDEALHYYPSHSIWRYRGISYVGNEATLAEFVAWYEKNPGMYKRRRKRQ